MACDRCKEMGKDGRETMTISARSSKTGLEWILGTICPGCLGGVNDYLSEPTRQYRSERALAFDIVPDPAIF